MPRTTKSGNETAIQGTLTQTLVALVDDLNGSADVEIAKWTYARPTGTETLAITFDTAGPTGNAFTFAASTVSASGPTLTGGGHAHVWESGADDIPSFTVEVGHPQLTTPVFFRHTGTVIESLAFEMGQEGPANARLQLVARGEGRFATTVDASPRRLLAAPLQPGPWFHPPRWGVARRGYRRPPLFSSGSNPASTGARPSTRARARCCALDSAPETDPRMGGICFTLVREENRCARAVSAKSRSSGSCESTRPGRSSTSFVGGTTSRCRCRMKIPQKC